MISRALTHELREILRSPARMIALGVLFAASVSAIVAGQRFHDQWQETVMAARAQERELSDEARSWLKNGEKGPADRPWVDISEPLWQDWYAGTRVAREPLPLAGVAFGAVDDSPVVIRVNRLSDPFNAAGIRIENPEMDRTSTLDLVFVFVVIVPIVIGVVGLGIGSFERERGLDRLITVQAGGSALWLVSRAVVATFVCLAAVLVVAGLTWWQTGAEASAGISFMLLAALYTLFWGGVLAAVSVTAGRVQEGAFAYGVVWVLLCVLVPTLLSERSVSSLAGDYAVDVSLESRAERYETYDRDTTEILPELYAAYPELTELPGAQGELPPKIQRLTYDGILVLALEQRHLRRADKERKASESARRAIWLSPAVALSHGFESLAGLGGESVTRYRDHVVRAVKKRVHWLLVEAWKLEPLGADDFEGLTRNAETYRASEAATGPHLLALGVWTIVVWTVGIVRIRRTEVLED